jgi:hypothetical protein
MLQKRPNIIRHCRNKIGRTANQVNGVKLTNRVFCDLALGTLPQQRSRVACT